MDSKIEIILKTDDSIDPNRVLQISFSAIADVPCPKSVRTLKDVDYKEIEDILKNDYGLKMVNLTNVRLISKTVAELEK